MSSSAVLGQYLWHELLTTDPEADAGFYAKVFGWNKLPYEGDAGYIMLGTAHGPVGGARVVGQDPLAAKIGPLWLTYVGVPDLSAALAAVADKGGRVLHPVTQVPGDGGRYAVIADPQGAVIGIYEPGVASSVTHATAARPMVWHELTAEDPQAALQFYSDIFGWDVVATHAMGGEVGNYYLFGQGTTQMGGAYLRARHLPPTWPRWLVYVEVPSVTAAVETAQAAGGQLLNGPHQVPGGTWVAQMTDPHGVPMALHGPQGVAAQKPKAALKPKAKPKAKAKTTPKAKTKTKVRGGAKTKPKSKTKTRAKAKGKRKSKGKTGNAPRSKGRTRIRKPAKSKRRTKTSTRRPSRKTPRRAK